MAAVEDCISAVIASPTATSTSTPIAPHHQPVPGPARTAGRSAGCSRSANPPIPSCKTVKPNSTSPNPASAVPAPDTRPRPSSLVIAPTKIIGSAADVNDTRTPMSAMSHPVPVVPTLAPNTRPSPCGNVSKPALTRPIVVIVVALDDCTTSVATAPQKAPLNGVAVAMASTVRSADPAKLFRPAVMTVMPSRKRPTPPRIEIVVDMCAPGLARLSGHPVAAPASLREQDRVHRLENEQQRPGILGVEHALLFGEPLRAALEE